MNTFWTTLIEINLILSSIYLGYSLLLKNLTFFRWARFYLLGGMLTGLIYPFLKARKVIHTPAEGVNITLPDLMQISGTATISWERWAVYLFSAILVLLLLRFIFRFFSLGKIHVDSLEAEFNGHVFRDTRRQVPPFSFWKWIYIHRKAHSEPEMKQIIAHEYIHTRERHTFDVIIAEICNIICWYNPLVKLLNRSVKDNLEFLVDGEVLNSGIDRISYQHSLVGISLNSFAGNYPGNQFAFKTLKKRIRMMNKEQSSRFRLLSYLLLTPLVLGFAGLLTISCQKEAPDTIAKTDKSEEIVLEGILIADKETRDTTAKAEKNEGVVLEGVLIAGKETRSTITKGEKSEGDILEITLSTPTHKETRGTITNGEKNEGGVLERTLTPATDKAGREPGTEGVKLQATGTAIAFEARELEADNKNNITLNGPVRLRGAPSHFSDAILILDGEEILNMDRLKVEDIQSITVLKGKSAIEKYGEKGKNGVIEIVSKKSPR